MKSHNLCALVASFAILLLGSGCTMPTYNLSRLPAFNVDKANEEYQAISDLEDTRQGVLQELIILLQFKEGKPTDEQRDELNHQLDLYLFHVAAATVYLYYGEYENMQKSVHKAADALEECRNIIHNIAQGSSA